MERTVPIPSLTSQLLGSFSNTRPSTPISGWNVSGLAVLDILRLRHFLFTKGLPNELINIILDEGEAWVNISHGKDHRLVVSNKRGFNTKIVEAELNDGHVGHVSWAEKCYLVTPSIPNYFEYQAKYSPRRRLFMSSSVLRFPTKVRKIKFTIISRCEVCITETSGGFSTKWPNIYFYAKLSSPNLDVSSTAYAFWHIPTKDHYSFDNCNENIITWDQETSQKQAGKKNVRFVDFLNNTPKSRIKIIAGAAGEPDFTRYIYSVKIDVSLSI